MNFRLPAFPRTHFSAARALAAFAIGCLSATAPDCLQAQAPAPEMRAMWVSRFEWPSSSEATAKANIDRIMTDIAANNFNTVLFQVRGQCDVHYPSPDEPWSNNYGWTDPGWDPLAYAIEEAHSRGLEFHAYINTHTLAAPVPPANTTPQHPLNLHGPSAPGEESWMIRDSGGNAGLVDSYYWISPANTEASAWTRKQILYIVKNYDVDGVHFDRIRSPGSTYTYDAATQRRWNSGAVSDTNPDGLDLADFMRSQITRDLRNIQGEIQYSKPWVKTSAAPFGIVKRDATTHYQGNGTQSYHSWFQDSWGWLQYHTLDFMVPQIYWEVGSAHPFELLLQDWMEHTGGRHVVAGSTTRGGTKSTSALLAEHEQTRLQNAHGHCVFSVSSMANYWSSFRTNRYDQPTTVPAMPWKTNPTVGIITGYVVDALGNPVVDAKVNLAGDVFQSPAAGPYNYLSAHDGFFSILDVAPGASRELTASKSDVGRKVLSGVAVAAGQVTSVTLVLTQSQGVVTLDRPVYSDSATAQITLIDGDLVGTPSTTVGVESPTEGGTEILTLTASGPGGAFTGSVELVPGPGPAVGGDGLLQVSHGDTVTVTYQDAGDGNASPAVATATATIDSQAPVISGVSIGQIGSHSARVTFSTDEPTTGVVRLGTSCASATLAVPAAGSATAHSVLLNGLTGETRYYLVIEAADSAGNGATDTNDGACYSFSTPAFTDSLTELFSSGDNDLDNQTLHFRPDGSAQGYNVCRAHATSFPTAPTGGTPLVLSDDSSLQVTLGGGAQVSLYGTSYSSFFVGSNGYITFGTASSDYDESLQDHFARAGISALYDDLNPAAGGTVSWKQLSDRVAVTWENVPEFNTTSSNSFQVELFFDGAIRLTYLALAASDGLIGLSRGGEIPPGFAESDFSGYPSCPRPEIELLPLNPVVFTLTPDSSVTATVSLTNATTGTEALIFTASGASLFGRVTTDTLSTGDRTSLGTNRYRGNVYEVTQSTRLAAFELELSFIGAADIQFVVYESESLTGMYHRVLSQTVSHNGSGKNFYSSGHMDLPLLAGRYYIIAAGWGGTSVRYYYNSSTTPPGPIAFGSVRSAFLRSGFPAPESITRSQSGSTYRQRLTTLDPWLSAAPAFGSVEAMDARELTLQASSAGFGQGTYPGVLEVRSNDPDEALVTLPVLMNVLDLPLGVTGHTPFDNATGLPQLLTLTWRNGGGASGYDVYFGPTNPPSFAGSTSQTQFDVGPLGQSHTYFWRVDSTNSVGMTQGATVSFRTHGPAAAQDWSLYE